MTPSYQGSLGWEWPPTFLVPSIPSSQVRKDPALRVRKKAVCTRYIGDCVASIELCPS